MHDAAMKSFGIALLSLGVLAQAAQLPFDYIRPTVSESSPNFIGEDSFTALLHPDFADHSVRVKRTSGWCEEKEAVRSFTGYIDSGARSLFLYYFDSRRNPAKDDLVLWTNGGYPETSVIKTYLDQPWVRVKLEVDDSIGPFQSCSNKVGTAFWKTQDSLAPTFYHLTGLLEHGVRVLIYVGKLDWICNFIGNYRMLGALEWSGQNDFNAEELREWSNEKGSAGGQTKSFGNLTYIDIRGAGHMVPLDKPKEALWMISNWLTGDSFELVDPQSIRSRANSRSAPRKEVLIVRQ